MTASLLQVLDITIANVAIPHMQSALGATAESVTWVLTSYIVAAAVFMPITGWLADKIGRIRAMIEQADATIAQVGPPPKKRIVDLGWSAAVAGGNNIESSTILEPILRLYEHTGYTRYLDFARYIVETEGGARRHHLIDEVLSELDPVEIGGVYPKAYEMLSFFEGLVEYYRATGNERWRRASLSLFQKVMLVGSRAKFAVVLLSSDDYGASRRQYDAEGVADRALQFRARQNVVLELGFFYGRRLLARPGLRVACTGGAGVRSAALSARPRTTRTTAAGTSGPTCDLQGTKGPGGVTILS